MMLSSLPLYLIAAALGYQTLTNATQQSSPNRRSFGRILGLVIIAVSLAMLVVPLLKYACMSSSCGMMSKMCS